MKRLQAWIAGMATAVVIAAGAAAADSPAALATRLLDQLDAGQYAAAEATFSPQMKAAVPAHKLKAMWESLPVLLGAAGARGEATVSEADGFRIVAIPLAYARDNVLARVVLDGDDRIAGFLVQPPPPPPPPPAADASFSEQAITLPALASGKPGLPGTLTLPRGKGPFPAVVLVHGSGPQDRDETIGGNRPFLDIARGLAAHGIASLRYDKRTRARPQDFSDTFGIDDETTDDAVAAVAALAGNAAIAHDRIHVLGHSQGGLLAGRIAARSQGKVAGLILLAAPARPILDLLGEQNRYLAHLDGSVSAEEQAHLDALDAAIAKVRRDPAAKLLELPGHYWQQLERIDPVADARASQLPVLLLQGGRDFQVVDADWQRWKQGLQGPRYRFHLYPALNHLGIAGEGKGTLDEYSKPGHVDATLIQDIVRWVQAQE